MKKRHRHQLAIGPLEPRLTPAAAAVSYTDIDGDRVRVTATLPGSAVPPLDGADLSFTDLNPDGQLATLTLSQSGFGGASIAFSVTRVPTGDGLAHVGVINAAGVDLDRVTVRGDLGKIVAGDAATANDPGLNRLQVGSMGTLGLIAQNGIGDLQSVVTGRLGALVVTGDLTDATFSVTAPDPADGQIGSIVIGGDLTGGAGTASGSLFSTGAMGPVRVGGDVIGGSGQSSGTVSGSGATGPVRIGGSVRGGAGGFSGQLVSNGTLGDVRIGGDVIGGPGFSSGLVLSMLGAGSVSIVGDLRGGLGENSGQVAAGGNTGLGDLRIGGDLVGGVNSSSGRVASGGPIGHVRIGGSLVGGSVAGAGTLFDSGVISANARIAGITIGGSLVAGTMAGTGTLVRSGAIVANDDLGPVRIGRSILGNATNPALIIARGQKVKPTVGFDVAIAGVRVGRDVRFAQILAGFDSLTPANADASIGPVTVGGDWVASSLVAGAQDAGAPGFGTGDTLQSVDDTPLVARIAGITIRGDATGTPTAGDHYGFVAQRIDGLRIGSRTTPLTAADDQVAIPFTNDLRLVEAG